MDFGLFQDIYNANSCEGMVHVFFYMYNVLL